MSQYEARHVKSRVDFLLFLKGLLTKTPDFTGQLELNFQDGELKDIMQKQRIRFETTKMSPVDLQKYKESMRARYFK